MNKLCKDCNWYKNNDMHGTNTGVHDECLCPEIEKEPNPVTGTYPTVFCVWQRLPSGKCGIDGKYWMEKKPPETKEQFWDRMFNFK
jgi:hypothetical protein